MILATGSRSVVCNAWTDAAREASAEARAAKAKGTVPASAWGHLISPKGDLIPVNEMGGHLDALGEHDGNPETYLADGWIRSLGGISDGGKATYPKLEVSLSGAGNHSEEALGQLKRMVEAYHDSGKPAHVYVTRPSKEDVYKVLPDEDLKYRWRSLLGQIKGEVK